MMKRLTVFLFIAFLLIGSIYAQDRSARPSESNIVTIEGTLKLERGFVAVESGDNVYYVPMLTRYIGFINALKEGERISVEGYGFRNIIHPTKITLDDRSYDFAALGRALNFGRQNIERQSPRPPQMREDPRFNNQRRENLKPGGNTPNPGRRNAPNRNTCGCNLRGGR